MMCKHCPLDKGAILRADGTCDWPPPVMDIKQISIDPDPSLSPTCGIGIDGWFFRYCHLRTTCENGVIQEQGYSGDFSITMAYRCTGGDYPELQYGGTTPELHCRNQEGEIDSVPEYTCE